MIYNTKLCFYSSCWFLADWVSRHVQWEVLKVFTMSKKLGSDWAKVDPEINWSQSQTEVTIAAFYCIINSQDPKSMFRFCFPSEKVTDGTWDTLFADTFNPICNTYASGPIMPELIADNGILIFERK